MGTGNVERPSATVWLPPLDIYFAPEVPTTSQNHLYALLPTHVILSHYQNNPMIRFA